MLDDLFTKLGVTLIRREQSMKFDNHSVTLGVISVIYNYILLNGDLIDRRDIFT